MFYGQGFVRVLHMADAVGHAALLPPQLLLEHTTKVTPELF